MIGSKKSSGFRVANEHYHNPLTGFSHPTSQYGASFSFLSIHFVAVIRIGDYLHNPFGKDIAMPLQRGIAMPLNLGQQIKGKPQTRPLLIGQAGWSRIRGVHPSGARAWSSSICSNLAFTPSPPPP